MDAPTAKDQMPHPAEAGAAPDRPTRTSVRRVNLLSALTGFGLAGLFDSLVLHRLLGWHHLLTGALPDAPLDRHIRQDSIFDAAMYLALLAGLTGMIRARKTIARIHPRCVAGMALIGFGLWNIADALIVHWLMGLHRIRPAAEVPLLWDIGWLAAFGLLPLLLGFTMRDTTPADPPQSHPPR